MGRAEPSCNHVMACNCVWQSSETDYVTRDGSMAAVAVASPFLKHTEQQALQNSKALISRAHQRWAYASTALIQRKTEATKACVPAGIWFVALISVR